MSLFDKLRGLFKGRPQDGDSAPISCHDALLRIQEFLDGELDDVSETEVQAHFDVCERCFPHLRLERCFRKAMRRAASQQAAPPELRIRLESLIAEAGSEG